MNLQTRTRVHVGSIRGMDYSSTNKFLVTMAEKEIKLWTISPEGTLLPCLASLELNIIRDFE